MWQQRGQVVLQRPAPRNKQMTLKDMKFGGTPTFLPRPSNILCVQPMAVHYTLKIWRENIYKKRGKEKEKK